MPEEGSFLDVAGAVAVHFAARGIDAVVVGGSAITVHVPAVYTSHDIDFAIPSEHSLTQIASSLAEIGFTRSGREFVSPDTIYSIDIVADIPMIEQEPTLSAIASARSSIEVTPNPSTLPNGHYTLRAPVSIRRAFPLRSRESNPKIPRPAYGWNWRAGASRLLLTKAL